MHLRSGNMDLWIVPGGRAPISRVALIGNATPRQCGIATYTSDTFDALRSRYPAMAIDFYAMNDPGSWYDYPPEVSGVIRQDEVDDYLRTIGRIERSGAQLVWVQHEFGIFGGPAGAHLLRLLEKLSIPIAITLHTVLDEPNRDQRAVMDRLIRVSDRLIVMAEKGRSILKSVYGVPDRQIAVIPHGVPDRTYVDPDLAKPALGLAGRKVMLTFGLVSPNKGIETMIEAMPAILAEHPDSVYVIAGATHPHLVAREGERYRDGLKALAERLGVASNLRWIEDFLDQEHLLDLIAASDIYVTPYQHLKQITSGTLSYAVALGKPVISTPYHHAAEIVGPDNGILADPGDVPAFASAACGLLRDEDRRRRMALHAYALGRSMIWRCNVEAAMAQFAACSRTASRPGQAGPQIALRGFEQAIAVDQAS